MDTLRRVLFDTLVIDGRGLLLLVMVFSSTMLVKLSAVHGAEWAMEPSMSAKGEYHSNLLLAFGPQKSTYDYWLSPGTNFVGSTENLRVTGRLAADFVQYYGGRDTTIVNLYFPLSAEYRGERSTLGFTGGFTRDNTLMGELLQTGVVLAFAQRNLWTANPTWTYQLTERLSSQASYQYQNATYDNGAEFGLVDYEVHTGGGTLSYQVRETDSIYVTGLFTQFLAPGGNNLVSDSIGVEFGGKHEFSERTTISASAGPRFISNTINPGSQTLQDSTTVWVANGKLTAKFERAQVMLDIGREILPSGLGILIQTDRVAVNLRYELTDKIAMSFGGRASFVDPVQTTTLLSPSQQTRFFTATPQLDWRVGEHWTVEASYRYSRRELEGTDQTANSHAAIFMVTYFPSKWSVGR